MELFQLRHVVRGTFRNHGADGLVQRFVSGGVITVFIEAVTILQRTGSQQCAVLAGVDGLTVQRMQCAVGKDAAGLVRAEEALPLIGEKPASAQDAPVFTDNVAGIAAQMYATGVAGLLQRLRLPQLTVFLRAVCVMEHGLDNVRIIRTILRHVEQEGSGAAFRGFRIRKTAKRAVEQDGSLCA